MNPEAIHSAQADETKRTAGSDQPIEAAQDPDALLTFRVMSALSGMSESTLRRLEKSDPTFPPFERIGARCTRGRAGPFRAWLKRPRDRARA